ncbi:hypothetical protein VTK26DRAFT_6483 [Humicola hyalothermophila]
MPSQLTAVCAVASFLWLTNNLEDHQIIEHPRLSSWLILLVAALSCYAASFGATWLPGANGRFDDGLRPLKVAHVKLPKKPRRYFLPALVLCIVLRLEIFHRVTYDLQCSKPGIEAFLALAILAYELLPGRRARSSSHGADDAGDPDDLGMTICEAVAGWFTHSNTSLSIGVSLLTFGTYLASSQDIKSTFFCSKHDRSALVISLQWLGLLLDAAIAILSWRILAWARTTKSRLRTLSGLLLASSFATALVYCASRLTLQSPAMSYQFRGLDSLFIFDVVVDGLTFSVCLISASLLATEGSPLSLASIITFLSGLYLAVRQTLLTGTWENLSPWSTYLALNLICGGFSLFVYANNIRSVVFFHRAFVVFLLVAFTVLATVYTPVKAGQRFDRHPLEKFIYDTRVEADRWLRYAAVSDSLSVAVQEYKERNNGRDPPPNFDIWYNFAKERKSVILDHFPQMKSDILPFWGMSPSKIRENIRRAASEPGIVMLQIRDGTPHHNLPAGNPYTMVVDDLVGLIKRFSKHLPDMELAINLEERPRVLVPWADVQRFTNAANQGRTSKLLPRAPDTLGKMPEFNDKKAHQSHTSVSAFREMTAVTCPAGTKARGGSHWDVRDLCTSCTKPQSRHQFPINWPLAQDICHQSDLLRLHSFHMIPPEQEPFQDLLPIFSRSKTDNYRDILIPLGRTNEPPEPTTDEFDTKSKKLFWRGTVKRLSSSHEVLRGGHQERLVHHTANRTSRSERTRLLVPSGANNNKWAFIELPTADLNNLLDIDVGFATYNACSTGGGSCDAVGNEPGTKPDGEPLSHQYVMVVDTDDGPAPEFLRTVRSHSVPFYASIFKEWYSDRILPWIHFVPIDLRFHALHNTLAYFLGIEKEDRSIMLRGRPEDGKWIADQGKRWAEKALRREDMEVYLFRLLLEWGRVVDDRRDELRFVLQS